jgi:hypothetical protein
MLHKALVHLRAQWMGALALFLVLAGGTAYSVNKLTGANIVNGSLSSADYRNNNIRGADVAADTLKGRDVKESSLAKVADADKLDGLDSLRYTRGAPAEEGAFAPASGRTYFNRLFLNSGAAEGTLLVIPGLLHVKVVCNTLALVRVVSDTSGLQISQDILTGNQFGTYNAGEHFQFNTSDTAPTYQGHVSAGTGANSFDGQSLVTMNLIATWDAASQRCHFQASALSQAN